MNTTPARLRAEIVEIEDTAAFYREQLAAATGRQQDASIALARTTDPETRARLIEQRAASEAVSRGMRDAFDACMRRLDEARAKLADAFREVA